MGHRVVERNKMIFGLLFRGHRFMMPFPSLRSLPLSITLLVDCAQRRTAVVTLEEFSEELKAVKVGQYAQMSHDVYAELFPPGEPDQGARDRCAKFARSHGFRIENKPDHKVIWFVKDA
jgi:hypothetical protein